MSEKAATSRDLLEAVLPLSPAQQGMLFESIAAPSSGVHVEQMSCVIEGALDAEAFERS